jgi:hypothetical protein
MADEKKHTVEEKIEVLMASNADGSPVIVEYKEFVEKTEELYKKNVHRAFTKFNIEMIKDKDLGWGLLFSGTREETKEETAKRETFEAAKRKQIDDAELKEYLRLKKKFGKKEDQQ